MGDRPGGGKVGLLLVGVVVLAAGAAALIFLIRPSDASVSGTVTLDSQPVGGAQVVFIGEEEKNAAPLVAQSDAQGAYQITGHTGTSNIPPGKYKVTVTKVALKDGTLPQGEKLLQAQAAGLLKNSLPKTYEDRSTTPLQFDIRPGANTVALELKKQP